MTIPLRGPGSGGTIVRDCDWNRPAGFVASRAEAHGAKAGFPQSKRGPDSTALIWGEHPMALAWVPGLRFRHEGQLQEEIPDVWWVHYRGVRRVGGTVQDLVSGWIHQEIVRRNRIPCARWL